MTDAQDLEVNWAQYRTAIAKANGLNKDAVFDALSAAGITTVQVNFDGEGDQGQIEYVGAFAGDKSVELPAVTVTLHHAAYGSADITSHELPLSEAVDEVCYGYLEQEYDGWENNDGAFGEFAFDVAKRRIALDFNARFTDYCHNDDTF